MNKLFIFLVFLLFLSCSHMNEKQDYYINTAISVGEIKNPAENLTWLRDLIKKAKTDSTGNYLGCIWLEKYKGQDVFVSNMMLGSGGVMYVVFDISGNIFVPKGTTESYSDPYIGKHYVYIDNEADFSAFLSNIKKDVLVFSPFPFPC